MRTGTQAGTFAVLDLLAQALLIAEASGHVLFANRAALGLVLSGEAGRPAAVRLTADRRIEAASRADDRALQALLRTPGGTGGIVLRHRAARPLVALVAALALHDGRGGVAGGATGGVAAPAVAASVVMLLPAEPTAAPSADMLRGLFGLSPAEAAVALAAAAGASAQAIAAGRGVAEPTVRAQLRRVLEKTGAGGLRQLARLFGSLADGLR